MRPGDVVDGVTVVRVIQTFAYDVLVDGIAIGGDGKTRRYLLRRRNA